MPGQPRTAALVAYLREEVEGRARVEIVLELYANGQMQDEIAAGVTLVYNGAPWSPSRSTLFPQIRKHWPDEWTAAIRERAESHAEAGLKAVKDAPETREGIAKARELATMYRWLAAKRDPATFGDAPATAIQINNPGQLFLQAVARPGALPPAKPAQLLSGDARGVGTAPKDKDDDGTEAD